MLEMRHGVTIASVTVAADQLPKKTGAVVAEELGGRYLLRYLLRQQVGQYVNGSRESHFVTPTAYRANETVRYLALPAPRQARAFVLTLDPLQVEHIWGPQYIRG